MKNNTKRLHIERIIKVDSEFIKEFNKVLEEEIIWDEKIVWDTQQGKKFIANPDNALFVAYLDNQIVGFLTAHRLQRFDNKKAEVFIYDVGVHKDFRQIGIGKALIAEVKKWAKEVGAEEAWVLTNRSNPAAMALYKSTGGTEDEPDIVMFNYKIKK